MPRSGSISRHLLHFILTIFYSKQIINLIFHAGDCWFLAALGAIAKFPELYSKVITESIQLCGDGYKGYFKASFWLCGKWVEVIIDDKLPVNCSKNLIYGRCTNKNNFWVPLLEKAYAKLLGSYTNMIGGNSVRALVDLTGLVFIAFKPGLMSVLPERYLVEDELANKNQLVGCCSIRFKKEGAQSDEEFDGHAYSILCINKIPIYDNENNFDGPSSRIERVYTIRNPHGENYQNFPTPIWSKMQIIDDYYLYLFIVIITITITL